jgi:RNA polymerase sigma factor (sigma-70 family)
MCSHCSLQVRRRRQLSRSEERALVLASRHCRDGKRAELVDVFTPRIAAVAREYRHVPAVNREELMQAGVVGLLSALERYDPSRSNGFWPYASWWVRQAMQDLVSSLSNAVSLSDRALRHLARVNHARRAHVEVRRREPSVRDLACDTGLATDHVRQLVRAHGVPRGLDQLVGGDLGGGRTIGESLSDPMGEDPYEDAALRAAAHALPAMLATLKPRDQVIVRGRYGLDGDKRTLRELAAELGLSPEGVRQAEQKAMRKLRETADPLSVRAEQHSLA